MRITETIAAQSLSAIPAIKLLDFHASFASSRGRVAVLSINVHRQLARRHVNTSLSWTLFFLMCWCIRDAVHLDSRVHAAIRLSH
jgi:hypothetical protein